MPGSRSQGHYLYIYYFLLSWFTQQWPPLSPWCPYLVPDLTLDKWGAWPRERPECLIIPSTSHYECLLQSPVHSGTRVTVYIPPPPQHRIIGPHFKWWEVTWTLLTNDSSRGSTGSGPGPLVTYSDEAWSSCHRWPEMARGQCRGHCSVTVMIPPRMAQPSHRPTSRLDRHSRRAAEHTATGPMPATGNSTFHWTANWEARIGTVWWRTKQLIINETIINFISE